MNKEDLWVTRTRVPVTGIATHHVQEPFDTVESTAQLEWWNLYQPQWAPIGIVNDPHQTGNKCLELRDEDPYDYALAERAFPESARVRIEFRVLARKAGHGVLEAEVQDRYGHRPLKIRMDGQWLGQDQMPSYTANVQLAVSSHDGKMRWAVGVQNVQVIRSGSPPAVRVRQSEALRIFACFLTNFACHFRLGPATLLSCSIPPGGSRARVSRQADPTILTT